MSSQSFQHYQLHYIPAQAIYQPPIKEILPNNLLGETFVRVSCLTNIIDTLHIQKYNIYWKLKISKIS